MTIPTLTTQRLVLREFRESDFPAYVEMIGDPEVARFLADGKPLDRVNAWRQMAMFAGHWTLRGYGIWAVEERATGNFIGRIGCFNPEGWPAFEIGYTLTRAAWGKGYASEGAAASLDYARNVLKKRDIISVIRPDNIGSQRVATRLGATLAETVDFYGAPALIYRYPNLD
ncbi:MAG TPA: GNAT family N-acetyltransferase [Gemmatimonadaceae bacterium]